MAGFNFERDLPHQKKAVESIIKFFDGTFAEELKNKAQANISNPIIKFNDDNFAENLNRVQRDNKIDNSKYQNLKKKILDISMETGTGKTYTYTKMMFELNKYLNQSKFIVIVPTLSIKAGTVSFLNAKATKEHFRQEYNREIKTYIVESKKGSKNKKDYMPQAVREFVEAHSVPSKKIHILIINQGMINSDTMDKVYDVDLFDLYNSPFKAISSLKPMVIIDEPHKFKVDNKTWQNIEKIKAQWIFRYGATFDGAEKNLLYKLSAVDAFNQDLVKGVTTYVEEFTDNQNVVLTLQRANFSEAIFKLNENGEETFHTIGQKESFSKIHLEMRDLSVEKSRNDCVVLSNGLEVTKNTKINPYSYSESIADKMIAKTITKHFELEKDLLTKDVKIKPLSLFFIDDISGYRDGHNIEGSFITKFETLVKAQIEKLLESEKNEFYIEYLSKSLKDISLTHGGYFSRDNTESDEKIEKEINDILHDKESLLSLDNTRRFIFSKWTLREGWDNPNVFQICKLRSSGSVTSKLQEVGRGLRLPVNEFMSRVKDGDFRLNYYVDSTEKDFAQSLVDEINSKSQATILESATKLSDELIQMISELYNINEDELLEKLDTEGIIKRNNDFKEDGYKKLKELYPAIATMSNGVNRDKIRNGNEEKKKTTIRVGHYDELRELWESINQKVILEYKIENEDKFYELLKGYLNSCADRFKIKGVTTHKREIIVEDSVAYCKEIESIDDEILPISYMKYKEFLVELATVLKVNINTLHKAFYDLKDIFDINLYLNIQTIKTIRSGFNKYLLDSAISTFEIGYNKISNKTHIHPTAFTDNNGNPLKEINSSTVGVIDGSQKPSSKYLFDEVFFDSDLERENIVTEIDEVIVFTKIPKNSIKIPVAGGGTYSPDFAYVIKDKKNNKVLNLVVETKNKEERNLISDEAQKIKHAQKFFENVSSDIRVEFKTQLSNKTMTDIIQDIFNKDK